MAALPRYVIDASALIDFGFWYQRETLPSIWARLEELARDGRLLCPREVMRELQQRSQELAEWITDHSIVISDARTARIISRATEIDRKYPELKKGKRRNRPNPRSADPWIVALALEENAVVVCSEGSQPSATTIRTIPDACRRENVLCRTLPELLKELGIKL